jgi:anti-anti-sigma factor
MRFKEEMHGEIPVFALNGEIRGGKGSQMLRDRISQHVQNHVPGVILDMNGVKAINVEGQNMLLGHCEICRKAGGRLAIVNIENIDSLLAVSKMVRTMEYFDSRDEALKAFGALLAGTE